MSWLTRLLTRRKPAPITVRGDEGPDAYPAAATGFPQAPEYDLRQTMSAMRSFALVFACVESITDDLASLPLIVERPTIKGWEADPDAPVLRLLENPVPTGRLGGLEMRRQIYSDYALARLTWLWVDQERNPRAVRRVHPKLCQPYVDAMGLPLGYEVGSAVTEHVTEDRIIQVSGVTWGDQPNEAIYPVSPIQVLTPLLNANLDIVAGLRRSSKLSRPDGVMSPPDGSTWTPEQAKRIGSALRDWLQGKGGVLMNPWGAKIDLMGFSPREMEFVKGLEHIDARVMSAFGVPPTRVGSQAANYATAQQEAIRNWEKRQGEAAVIDEALTRLSRKFDGYERSRVRHDFSGVDALQAARTEKLLRVQVHIANGLSPEDAYKIEGLHQAAEAAGRIVPPAGAQPSKDDRKTAVSAALHLRASLQLLERHADGLGEEQVADLRATLEEAARLRVAS